MILIIPEEVLYIKGIGLQVNTRLLNGKTIREFYKIEDINDLGVEDILSGVGGRTAITLSLKGKKNKVVLFEVALFGNS